MRRFAVTSLLLVLALPARCAAADDERVDDSIVRALRFLSLQQSPNGSWLATGYGESTAATSLAVMAFMAAGHVPGEGAYGLQLERGIRWVIDHQRPDGLLVHKTGHGPMYDHGISTLMLAEALGMVDRSMEKPLREALERAVALILKSQNVAKPAQHAGGWRYHAGTTESDLSVTGWQLLALRAARNVGCDVPAENIDRAVEYVRRCHARDGGFAYQPGGGSTATRTGTGILALEICGQHHTEEALAGGELLLRRPLREGDHYFFYGAYYCGVGMFQMGGPFWDGTKAGLAQLLLEKQNPDGSWSGQGGERTAGPVYCTSLAVLSLAVEYQYLPIYQR